MQTSAKANLLAFALVWSYSNLLIFAQRHIAALLKNFQGFPRGRDRLETFYFAIVDQDPEFLELFAVVRLVLTLFDGNANIESGFSINADMLVENLR